MKKRRRSFVNVCLLLLGIILIGLGLFIFFYFEIIYDFLIQTALVFNKESKAYQAWQINNPPLEMDIYLFNWTNPEDLKNNGVKPRVEEIGPYRFKEVKEKINITWNENNTITYKHRKWYYFDDENSIRRLDDLITILNPVPLTIAYKSRYLSYFARLPVTTALSTLSSLYVTKTAGEILFDGYEETILSALSIIPFADVHDKFGFFYGKNGTQGTDGVFNMWTKNDENFGKISTWNYKNHSGFYDGECGDVKGSAGEFHPINRKKDVLPLFSSELCKFANLEYEKEVTIKGVKGYKFTAKNIFDNGTLRSENECFCNGECIPSGLLNVSSCREGSPTFLSMPHFYNADPYYINAVEGIHPEDKHEFYITIEPKSGIAIDVSAKMQVNLLLQPIDGIRMYQDVPKIFFPVFYFDQVVTLSDELASNLVVIQSMPEISLIAVLISISLGLLSLIWFAANIFCCRIKDDERDEEYKMPHEEIPLRS